MMSRIAEVIKRIWLWQLSRRSVEGASGFTGTPELWEKIDKAISLIIDAAALFLFPHDD